MGLQLFWFVYLFAWKGTINIILNKYLLTEKSHNMFHGFSTTQPICTSFWVCILNFFLFSFLVSDCN